MWFRELFVVSGSIIKWINEHFSGVHSFHVWSDWKRTLKKNNNEYVCIHDQIMACASSIKYFWHIHTYVDRN